ncbi:MAG TPA: methyltransferase, partial [Vineibacter sp.]|nr:methyltransferase [Vineibacter sp.]
MPLEPTRATKGPGRPLAPDLGERWAFWNDRWHGARDRLLASARFQRWAAGFPLTKLVARRRARALFDICAGFVYSQVLLACVRLGLLEILREGPQSVDVLARRLSLPVPAMRRLLAAAVALRLVERRGKSRFGLGVLGAASLGNPGIAAMVEHHALLYADLRDPVTLLREGKIDGSVRRFWSYATAAEPEKASASDVEAYSALMAVSQPMIANDVIDAWPIARHQCLLDVGGGEGAFIAAVAARVPSIRLMLFDLPAVAARASKQFAALGLSDRVAVIGGDFRRDPLPSGGDIVTLVRVLHDHDDGAALALLRAIHAALPADGRLLVAEPMADDTQCDPV